MHISNRAEPSRPPDQDDDVLDRIYDVALNPDRFEELVDFWQSRFDAAAVAMDLPYLGRHMERAEEFLERLDDPTDELTAVLSRFEQVAAFAIGADLRVMQVNEAAHQQFALTVGSNVKQLPFHGDDCDVIQHRVLRLFKSGDPQGCLLRVRGADKGQIVVVHLVPIHVAQHERLVLVTTSMLAWPLGVERALRAAFGLTTAEVEVVRHLTMTTSLQEVADLRGRAIATVRTQLKTILHKTETKSQVELVRLVLSMTALAPPATPTLDTNPQFQMLTLPDGRRMQYRTFGARSGTPLVFWPSDYGFHVWPSRAEAAAIRMGLRVIVPVRGGYGASDPIPADVDVTQAIVQDVAHLLGELQIDRCAHMAIGIDFVLALRFAEQFPHRSRGITACSGVLPVHGDMQLARMDKWHRFILATAHFSPRLLPFFVKAGFLMARRQGKEAFVRAVFGGSKADMDTFADPGVRQAILQGTDLTLSQDHSAHEMFARLTAYQMTQDWGRWLASVRGTVPISFLCGLQDTQVPQETLAEYQRAYPWINFQLFPDAGRLVFFRHWQAALSKVTDFEK
ncbi:hypothetical protein J7426_16500 [Tropicibacter sp. R16_0]|uniref:hypothetical protein n=1 Tax=Tropicibacter sp. R16_0 TaxID=2821102 RepID=UPI001ADD3084|nr:hypothetical protein [Tropicibacter sp. R16_0]MBO9451877.1 hypothetical protein [Tropicibacter sp. R16_0]